MNGVKTQFGISATADFEDNTWTFEMPPVYAVSAGEFAIVPKEYFDQIVTDIEAIKEAVMISRRADLAHVIDKCDDTLIKLHGAVAGSVIPD